MGSTGAAKVSDAQGNICEDSETTVEIKIKTLDSQIYTMRVNKFVPVPALKEQIANVTGILSEQQRLICRGKVLKDDQLLSEYHVEDGHTLHLVLRQPHQSGSTSYSGGGSASRHPEPNSTPGNTQNHSSPVPHSFVVETVNVEQGDIDNSMISRIISSMLDSFGPTNARTGTTTNDIREMILERVSRASGDNGSADSTHPLPNPPGSQRASRTPSVPLSSQSLPVIPDSLTTLNQYISFMKAEYGREGLGVNANSIHHNDGQNHLSHSHAALGGLPSPASLAEILHSTRRLLMEQTGESFSQLALQLEGHTNVTDPLTRMNMQSSVIRSGVLMQNLGSMLLELGRTTMTLRMGQSPAEAIVNAGPANFISANGPNPLMVQPVPFFPGPNTGGIHMGPTTSNSGLESEPPQAAPTFVPRNIEIRIRTVGRAVPAGATSNVNHEPSQQQPEQTDQSRNSSGGESGVRVVPLRTVVAVPSGANPSPTDSLSANPVQLFYPLISHVRQQTPSMVSDQQQTENLESRDNNPSNTVPWVNLRANESGFPHIFASSSQGQPNNSNDDVGGNSASHDTSGVASDPGVFLSNVLRQLMPMLSQGRVDEASTSNITSTAQVEREDFDGSSSSRHRHDPPDSPSPKRMKKE